MFEGLSAAASASNEEKERMAEEWWHPDIEYVEDPSWPGSATYRGRETVRRTFEAYTEILGATLRVEDVRVGTDGVFALVRYTGSSTGADVPFDQLWGYHCRIRDGQLGYFRAYFDADEAMRDAGVT
jgi:ketosteroid isomerase-like protein